MRRNKVERSGNKKKQVRLTNTKVRTTRRHATRGMARALHNDRCCVLNLPVPIQIWDLYRGKIVCGIARVIHCVKFCVFPFSSYSHCVLPYFFSFLPRLSHFFLFFPRLPYFLMRTLLSYWFYLSLLPCFFVLSHFRVNTYDSTIRQFDKS